MANVYSWKDIKEKVRCAQYLADKGINLDSKGRCAASWRGGTNAESVHIDNEQNVWHDFSSGHGGSVIDLCAEIECGDDCQMAVQKLGERYNITAFATKKKVVKTRSQVLLGEGYQRTASYDYCDENGTVVYTVDRYEKEGAKKEFVQRTPEHEGLDKDTPRMLYNLPAVIKSKEVYIVEGEKDVETLRSFGIVATTNSGGASNSWDNDQNFRFSGKDVVVICDNDEPGKKHGENLNAILKQIASSVKVLTISKLPKGDVTDWVQKEGGSSALLREIVEKTCEKKGESPELARAKMANETGLSNFCEMIVAAKGGRSKKEEVPKTIRELANEVHERFLGYPRVLGETMFDWNKDTHDIVYLTSKNELFAWIQSTSRHNVVWGTGNNYVTRDELFCELNRTSIHYSGISKAPHYPMRKDVFYTHSSLPSPDPSHFSFWHLVDYFSTATPAHKTLIAAFIAAPIYYSESASRPMWIIDTDDAQGSGKSTLAKLVAKLYGDSPFVFDLGMVNKDLTQLMRRMISSSGRMKRMALLDNVVGSLRSPNLATLVTLGSLTGLAPYGRTEESRPNDVTYVVTVNGAVVDTDIATRSYTVRLKAPKDPSPTWESEVGEYIEKNRLQIFADLLHMIEHNPLNVLRKRSRFGMFDKLILSAVCRNEEEFNAVDRAICNEADRANEDQDRALEFLELFLEEVASCTDLDTDKPFFVRAQDINYMLENTSGELAKWTFAQVQQLVKTGMLDNFDRRFERIPGGYDGVPRWRGIMHGARNDNGLTELQILQRTNGHAYKKLTTISLAGIIRK